MFFVVLRTINLKNRWKIVVFFSETGSNSDKFLYFRDYTDFQPVIRHEK